MAPATKRVSRTKKAAGDALDVCRTLGEFLGIKSQVKTLTKREGDLKVLLSEYVDENGYTDDRGHLWIDLPSPVEGPDGFYDRIQRQRRVGEEFSAEAAEAILTKKGLTEQCSKTYLQVTDPDRAIAVLKKHKLLDEGFELFSEIDADEVRKAFYREQITKSELGRIFTQKITWAFLPSKKR